MTRSLPHALAHGARCRCPRCGGAPLFRSFLKVMDTCPACGQELFHHRADDAPPYVVMLIVGHVVVGLMLMVEMAMMPPLWLHAAIFLPMTLALSLVLLPPVKGCLIALQWANGMHGFDPDPDGTAGL